MSTPESPFGALLRPGSCKMSPDSRKKLKRNFDAFPSPLTSKQTKPETVSHFVELNFQFLWYSFFIFLAYIRIRKPILQEILGRYTKS